MKTLSMAALMAALLLGCAVTRTHESAGELVDDPALAAQVKSALLADPHTAARDISVATYRGVVQLSGFVDSGEDRREAARAAGGVEGVRIVRNDLQLESGGTVGRAIEDDAITARVKAALVCTPATQAHQIEVTTDKGLVLLSGFVDSNDERDAAAAVARSVNGVTAVNNSLRLKPAP